MGKVATFFICIPLVFIALSPMFLDGIHHELLTNKNAPLIQEDGMLFLYPTECWMFTPLGVLLSFVSIGILGLAGWFFSRKCKDFSFKQWLVVMLLFAIFPNEAPISKYFKHKNDYAFIGVNKIEWKYGKREYLFRISEINSIKQKGRAFIIRDKSDDSLRIKNTMINQLNGNSELRAMLQELTATHTK